MGLFDDIIAHHFRCTKCGGEISVPKRLGDEQPTTCPFCEEESLSFLCTEPLFSIIIDNNTPKTLGSLAAKHSEEMEKAGTLPKKPKKENPWWRKNKKVNFNVLKHPDRYIHTGRE